MTVFAKFLDKLVGSFLQLVAISMNWCEMRSIDILWRPLKIQWQGVGTLQDRWDAHSVNAWFAAVNMRP
ncbi:hypothetical protein BK662_06685 [Pseudomonas frederiksbergensis]|uniref:Uncharacterized protein n=1 Tax=Pseudomonas frederiksbergensis TaxID=104087 RepID=A0A423HW46_9PSED|nr:hypothetical protein BK662_06685 [Pseudomonas frederiksbergensis]